MTDEHADEISGEDVAESGTARRARELSTVVAGKTFPSVQISEKARLALQAQADQADRIMKKVYSPALQDAMNAIAAQTSALSQLAAKQESYGKLISSIVLPEPEPPLRPIVPPNPTAAIRRLEAAEEQHNDELRTYIAALTEGQTRTIEAFSTAIDQIHEDSVRAHRHSRIAIGIAAVTLVVTGIGAAAVFWPRDRAQTPTTPSPRTSTSTGRNR